MGFHVGAELFGEDSGVIGMKSGRNSVPMVVGVMGKLMGKRVNASYTLDIRVTGRLFYL